MTSKKPSVAGRAVLALVLMVGFYGLALAVAAGLTVLPIIDFHERGRLNGRLVGCWIVAAVILWSILPRIDRFKAPGPRLTPDRHPRLFAALREIAGRTGQEMPDEVYLLIDANAWVTQRGGVMGFRSRRVMGLGLPLMQALSVAQMKAVIAHEFGHFHGGDTKLGPWVYKTRAAILRTVHGLASLRTLVGKLFEWYARMFLRITHAVSRAQEHAADALAARVVGSRALAEGLEAVHGAAEAFQPYWRDEVSFVLDAGRLPALGAGFETFLGSEVVSRTIRTLLENELTSESQDPYDTHPPLKERLAAVRNAAAAEPPASAADDARAVSLLDDVSALERELLVHLFAEKLSQHRPIEWSDVGRDVYLPLWRKSLAEDARHLAGITALGVPDALGRAEELGRALGLPAEIPSESENLRARGCMAMATAVAVVLADEGWTVSALPGETVVLRRGELELRPFDAVRQLATGELTHDAWRQRVEQAGIAQVELSALGHERLRTPA